MDVFGFRHQGFHYLQPVAEINTIVVDLVGVDSRQAVATVFEPEAKPLCIVRFTGRQIWGTCWLSVGCALCEFLVRK